VLAIFLLLGVTTWKQATETRAREVREDLARQGLAAFTVDYRDAQ
jgi:hypothetical protein